MHFFKSVLSLALLAGSALAQASQMQISYPPAGSTLTVGEDFTVQIYTGDYVENVDVAVVVISLAEWYGGEWWPASDYMGDVLYQGAYTPQEDAVYANYTLTVPQSFPPGNASLDAILLYMVGAEFEPGVVYLNENVTVVG